MLKASAHFERRPFPNHLFEVSTLHELHHDVVERIVLPNVVNSDDVGVCSQAGGEFGFLLETLQEGLIARVFRMEDLDRNVAAEPRVHGTVNRGHPAFSDESHEAVPIVQHGIGLKHRRMVAREVSGQVMR